MDDNATPTVVRYLGRLLGLTETQTAWRWRGWRARVASVGRVLQPSPPAEAGAPRQVRCQHCRAVQIEADLVCSVCGKAMITRIGRLLRQWAHHVPSSINAAMYIVTLHVMVYVWLSTRYPTHAVMGWDIDQLLQHGALGHGPDGWRHQPWRLGTAMVMHIGVLHLAMNSAALLNVGPAVEEIMGRGRMLFWYVVTGIGGNIVSMLVLPDHVVSAGASGAIMGLCGMAAMIGHRLGPGQGYTVRNRMLQWAVITLVYGYFLDADNAAHLGGFLVGASVGLLQSPLRMLHTQRTGRAIIMGALGIIGYTALVVLAMVGTPTP